MHALQLYYNPYPSIGLGLDAFNHSGNYSDPNHNPNPVPAVRMGENGMQPNGPFPTDISITYSTYPAAEEGQGFYPFHLADKALEARPDDLLTSTSMSATILRQLTDGCYLSESRVDGGDEGDLLLDLQVGTAMSYSECPDLPPS
jgi:hypothetical protein